MDSEKAQLLDAVCALVVCIDAEGRITHWNSACTELTGYSLDEVLGHPITEFLIVPEEQEAVTAEITQVKSGAAPRPLANHWITRGGDKRWIEWSSIVYRDARGGVETIVATGIDRTQTRQAEEAVQLSEKRFSGILNIAADAIISVNTEQKIVIYNQGAETIFGWTHDEALGQPLDMLIPEGFRQAHRAHVDNFSRVRDSARRMGERIPGISGIRKSGEEFPAEAAISKLDTEQGPLLTVILRDVSERRQLEKALRDEIQARDDLSRTVVHDLRNPLGSILLRTQLLMTSERNPSAQLATSLDHIARAAEHMTQLLNDLLDATRIEAKALSVNKKPLSLPDVLKEAADTMMPSARAKDINLQVEAVNFPRKVNADRVRLLQVLGNLLGNAIKFTPAGGRVALGAEECDESVLIRVSDTGPGIPPGSLKHLFDPYWQADRSDRRGAGLGLTIAKGIVQAHGGRIWADSTPGVGSTFVFILPKAKSLRKQCASSEP